MSDAPSTVLGDDAPQPLSPLLRARPAGASFSSLWPAARDRIAESLLLAVTLISALVVLLIVAFVVSRGWTIFAHQGVAFVTHGGWDIAMQSATGASEWGGAGKVVFGAWPLIAGTMLTTGGAVTLAALLGMGCAIFLANLAPAWLARPVEAVVRLLAGIPSVVFGLIGLTVIVPWIQAAFVSQDLANRYPDLSLTGESLLAGILVLSFMILPFFVAIATDSLRAVPDSYQLGGLALGMTRWRAITRLVVPPAIPGLVAGLVLASARAVGEAIALSMVAGAMSNVPNVAHGLVFFLEPVRTMASAIVEGGDSMQQVPQIQVALFGVATLLLAMSLVLSVTARAASASFAKRMHLISDRSS